MFNNTHAILLSKYLYPDVQKYFSVERVHYCPNGIPDIDKRHKIQEKQHDKNNEIVKILFLSNLIESKGVFILLEACKILNQKDHRFKSIYVGGEGDVNEQQFQEKVKKLELTEQVAYVGKKYGSEKASVFASADIFAFPTYYYYECLPLVLLESMQHSLPIVSTFEGEIGRAHV